MEVMQRHGEKLPLLEFLGLAGAWEQTTRQEALDACNRARKRAMLIHRSKGTIEEDMTSRKRRRINLKLIETCVARGLLRSLRRGYYGKLIRGRQKCENGSVDLATFGKLNCHRFLPEMFKRHVESNFGHWVQSLRRKVTTRARFEQMIVEIQDLRRPDRIERVRARILKNTKARCDASVPIITIRHKALTRLDLPLYCCEKFFLRRAPLHKSRGSTSKRASVSSHGPVSTRVDVVVPNIFYDELSRNWEEVVSSRLPDWRLIRMPRCGYHRPPRLAPGESQVRLWTPSTFANLLKRSGRKSLDTLVICEEIDAWTSNALQQLYRIRCRGVLMCGSGDLTRFMRPFFGLSLGRQHAALGHVDLFSRHELCSRSSCLDVATSLPASSYSYGSAIRTTTPKKPDLRFDVLWKSLLTTLSDKVSKEEDGLAALVLALRTRSSSDMKVESDANLDERMLGLSVQSLVVISALFDANSGYRLACNSVSMAARVVSASPVTQFLLCSNCYCPLDPVGILTGRFESQCATGTSLPRHVCTTVLGARRVDFIAPDNPRLSWVLDVLSLHTTEAKLRDVVCTVNASIFAVADAPRRSLYDSGDLVAAAARSPSFDKLWCEQKIVSAWHSTTRRNDCVPFMLDAILSCAWDFVEANRRGSTLLLTTPHEFKITEAKANGEASRSEGSSGRHTCSLRRNAVGDFVSREIVYDRVDTSLSLWTLQKHLTRNAAFDKNLGDLHTSSRNTTATVALLLVYDELTRFLLGSKELIVGSSVLSLRCSFRRDIRIILATAAFVALYPAAHSTLCSVTTRTNGYRIVFVGGTPEELFSSLHLKRFLLRLSPRVKTSNSFGRFKY